jgi:hypothetical protein
MIYVHLKNKTREQVYRLLYQEYVDIPENLIFAGKFISFTEDLILKIVSDSKLQFFIWLL